MLSQFSGVIHEFNSHAISHEILQESQVAYLLTESFVTVLDSNRLNSGRGRKIGGQHTTLKVFKWTKDGEKMGNNFTAHQTYLLVVQ